MASTREKLDPDEWPRIKLNEADRQVAALYRRYVQQGAHVAWATHFGHVCSEPDFAAAARFNRQQLLRGTRHVTSRHRWALSLGVIGLLGVVTTWLSPRRRAAL